MVGDDTLEWLKLRDHLCNKPLTNFGRARIIQQAWINYKRRPASFAKRVWEAARNDDTPKDLKFLGR